MHFTGYSLNPQQLKEDDKAMTIILHSIIGTMHLLQTDAEKNHF